MAPSVDSIVALSRELIFWRIEFRASPRYLRNPLSIFPVEAANANVSITALRRAWSSNPFRRINSSETLKTGSVACWDLPGSFQVNPTRYFEHLQRSYIGWTAPVVSVTLQRAFGTDRERLQTGSLAPWQELCLVLKAPRDSIGSGEALRCTVICILHGNKMELTTWIGFIVSSHW